MSAGAQVTKATIDNAALNLAVAVRRAVVAAESFQNDINTLDDAILRGLYSEDDQTHPDSDTIRNFAGAMSKLARRYRGTVLGDDGTDSLDFFAEQVGRFTS